MRQRDYRASEGDEIFLTFEGMCSRGFGGGAENRGLTGEKKKKLTKKERKERAKIGDDDVSSRGRGASSVEDGFSGGYDYDEQNAPLYALLRLRFNDNPHAPAAMFPEIDNCALIRELHVYGVVAPSRKTTVDSDKVQHTGYGRRLMREAERIAVSRGYKKIAVISGIGVRNYYRKLGYELRGLYMVKDLNPEEYVGEDSPVVKFGERPKRTASEWSVPKILTSINPLSQSVVGAIGIAAAAVVVIGLVSMFRRKL
jgi:GNAT superfamily N-acetyltransferase